MFIKRSRSVMNRPVNLFSLRCMQVSALHPWIILLIQRADTEVQGTKSAAAASALPVQAATCRAAAPVEVLQHPTATALLGAVKFFVTSCLEAWSFRMLALRMLALGLCAGFQVARWNRSPERWHQPPSSALEDFTVLASMSALLATRRRTMFSFPKLVWVQNRFQQLGVGLVAVELERAMDTLNREARNLHIASLN